MLEALPRPTAIQQIFIGQMAVPMVDHQNAFDDRYCRPFNHVLTITFLKKFI